LTHTVGLNKISTRTAQNLKTIALNTSVVIGLGPILTSFIVTCK